MINNLVLKFKIKDTKDKVIIKNIIYSFLVRALALILALIKMPIYIKYFNNEEILGIWFTILSILTWIFNFDLGIGNGLRNKLVKPIEEKNNKEIKMYISSAYTSILILIIFVGVVLSIIIPNVNWNIFFNTTTELDNSVFIKTMFIVMIGLLVQFLLKLINSILYALQKSFFPALFNFITEFILLIVIVSLDSNISISDKLPIVALNYSLCACIPLLIANIVIFTSILKSAKPGLKYFSPKYAKSILFIGGMFFWIQIMYMIIVNTNEYLITWFVGPKYVVEYQIYNKIFSLIGTLFTLMLSPMWSMVTKALALEDYEWIKKLYIKLKKLTILAIIAEFALIPFMSIIVKIWLGRRAFAIKEFYSILFAISGSLLIWNGVISTIVNGIGKLKIQFIFMTLGVCLNIPMAYIFCKIFDSWIGVILANIISFLPYCIVQPFFIDKYIKEKGEKK